MKNTFERVQKGNSWMRIDQNIQWNWLMYERKLSLVENE